MNETTPEQTLLDAAESVVIAFGMDRGLDAVMENLREAVKREAMEEVEMVNQPPTREEILRVVDWAAHYGLNMGRKRATGIVPSPERKSVSLAEWVREEAERILFGSSDVRS